MVHLLQISAEIYRNGTSFYRNLQKGTPSVELLRFLQKFTEGVPFYRFMQKGIPSADFCRGVSFYRFLQKGYTFCRFL
jgi:hypothetical protein